MSDPGVGAGEHATRSHAGGPSEPAGVAPTQEPRRRERVAVVLIAGALAVCLFSAGALFATLSGGQPPAVAAAPSAPTPTPTPTPAPAPTVTVTAEPEPVVTMPAPVAAAAPAPTDPGAPPVQVLVPDLEIDETLLGLSVTSDGQMQVPDSADDVGWWSDGPSPGDPGAALMVGHVDSTEGPGVFYHLSSLEEGAVVSVRRADGRTVRFAVTGTQVFAKDDFPDELVYRTDGKPSLHLVTCGGSFDREVGHYRDNVVVFADLIEETPDPAATSAEDPPSTPASSPASTPGGVTAEEKASADKANAAIAEAGRNGEADAREQDEEDGR